MFSISSSRLTITCEVAYRVLDASFLYSGAYQACSNDKVIHTVSVGMPGMLHAATSMVVRLHRRAAGTLVPRTAGASECWIGALQENGAPQLHYFIISLFHYFRHIRHIFGDEWGTGWWYLLGELYQVSCPFQLFSYFFLMFLPLSTYHLILFRSAGVCPPSQHTNSSTTRENTSEIKKRNQKIRIAVNIYIYIYIRHSVATRPWAPLVCGGNIVRGLSALYLTAPYSGQQKRRHRGAAHLLSSLLKE
eukprot:gene7406-5215_t